MKKLLSVFTAAALGIAPLVSCISDSKSVVMYSSADESEWTEDGSGAYMTKDITTFLNLRQEPDISSDVLLLIPAGSRFTVLKLSDKWANIEYEGITGYVSTDYIQKITSVGTDSEIIIENTAYPEWFISAESGFYLSGIVRSNLMLSKVYGGVYSRYEDIPILTTEISPETDIYDISELFNSSVDISTLEQGDYTYKVYAEDLSGFSCELVNSEFTKIDCSSSYFSRLMGDVNGDNELTIADAVIFQKFLINEQPVSAGEYVVCDMNYDTRVDAFDMIIMKKRLIKNVSEPDTTVMLDVIEYNQHPDYPTGCESVALYMLLNYYGASATVDDIISSLPKGPAPYIYDGYVYGANPEREFVGDPYSVYSYGVFNEPIAQTANLFLSGAVTKKGADLSEVISLLDDGKPSVVWYTTNPDKAVSYKDSWYDYLTGEYISWPAGEHAVVVCGHDSETLTYRDPNTGSSRTILQSEFKKIFDELGGRIVYYNK